MHDKDPSDPKEEISLPGGGVLRSSADSDREIPVSFADIVQPFWLMGLASLGVVPHPDSNSTTVDLPRAKAAVETLELLRARTEGRLEESEQRVLDQAIYELQMQLRLVHQLHQLDNGLIPDNYINPANLTDLEKEMLKNAFSVIERLQSLLNTIFPVV